MRPAAVAGKFYPGGAAALRQEVRALLTAVTPGKAPGPKAIIAPHAGYVFSGPIAAFAFAEFAGSRGAIKRVIVAGPSHYVGFEGIATSSAAAFETPLGCVAVDREAVAVVEGLRQVKRVDEAHAREHSLEVELPFLQELLGAFSIVPLAVGEASAREVNEVLEAVWGGPETRILISSDLSHYHDWATAARLDAATARMIVALAPEDLGPDRACGATPIGGLLLSAQRHGLRGRLLDLRSSGDTAGTRDRVVGYGAFSFDEP